MGLLDRRQFVFRAAAVGASTVVIAGPRASTASAATDDDLAFANFGIAAELLLADFYTQTLAMKDLDKPTKAALRAGKLAAGRHTRALGDLLVGAGQTAPEPDDFAFVWPTKTFKDLASATAAGLSVLRPTMGAYQTATVSVTEPTYGVLFASLAGSLGQQAGALAGGAGVEPFPVAISLESASGALDGYLG